MLSGASVRYRFYTRWGVTAAELSRIVFSYSVTFWLGLFALGGLSLVDEPRAGRGVALAGAGVARAGRAGLLMVLPSPTSRPRWCGARRFACGASSCRCRRPRIALAQLLLSAVDWALAGAVLYVLLPPSALPFLAVLGVFLVAILLGMASHVPGGVGVFEGLMVLLLAPYLASAELAARARRLSRRLLPAAAAGRARRAWSSTRRGSAAAHVVRAAARPGAVTEQLTPRVLAVFTFLAGVVLLVLGRDAGRAGAAGAARARAAARRHRSVALPRQRRRRRRCCSCRRGWRAGSTPRTT